MPASPPIPSSPPASEWHEYKPVPSALDVLDARFEAFVYEQSRLLGEAHRCLKGHEKHLQRQQKRLVRLEERVDELLLRPLALGEQGGFERQIGKFKIVEGSANAGRDAHLAGVALEDSGKVAVPQTQPPLVSKIPRPSWEDAKSDEEAWEESLGFGHATHNVVSADLRPQHGYRRSVSALAVDTKDTAQPSLVDKTGAGAVGESGERQEIDREKFGSGHSPAPQVFPPGAGHLSMVEMLDQLGEELMGFERERWGKGKG